MHNTPLHNADIKNAKKYSEKPIYNEQTVITEDMRNSECHLSQLTTNHYPKGVKST
jgi:hypothetical protein